ncbi:MAG: HlyD family secretion protein [Betaproteobacteria bacterium]|jgi:membrane fusion protein (multidrug efflux system)|nr:HlyD family secretion protein [Betaproteobacteria bacterium]
MSEKRVRRIIWPRRLVRGVLLGVVPLAAVAAGLHYYVLGGRYEVTENAYVKANIIAVSAEVAGRVVEVAVRDNQPVDAGALLFRLDPTPFELEVARAEAQMAVVRTELEALRASYRVALAEAAEAESSIGFLTRQLERQRMLKARGMGREESYDEAQHNLDAAQRKLDSSRQRARSVLASLGGEVSLPPERHPRYLQAMAARDTAQVDLARARVVAPAGGVVSNMKLQVGEHVARGVPVFSLIESGHVWVEANYKETQLTYMREGQRATVAADAYPGSEWEARVSAIAPATGAEFAVLPPQNATGNWVKVVQRIPVVIQLDPVDGAPPLRAGMTVSVSIDTGRERTVSGSLRELLGLARAEPAVGK